MGPGRLYQLIPWYECLQNVIVQNPRLCSIFLRSIVPQRSSRHCHEDNAFVLLLALAKTLKGLHAHYHHFPFANILSVNTRIYSTEPKSPGYSLAGAYPRVLQPRSDTISPSYSSVMARAFIAQLPIVSETDLIYGNRCGICHEIYGTNIAGSGIVTEHAIRLPSCGHEFGIECLSTWLSPEAGNNSCPLCRSELFHFLPAAEG